MYLETLMDEKLYTRLFKQLHRIKMKNRPIKKRYYLLLASIVLTIEVIIAIFFKGSFVRQTFGDFLVVILLYLMVKSCFEVHWLKAALSVLCFAYFVEFLQWVNILEVLGLQRSLTTDLILGSFFDWKDILAYSMGILFVIVVEYSYRLICKANLVEEEITQ